MLKTEVLTMTFPGKPLSLLYETLEFLARVFLRSGTFSSAIDELKKSLEPICDLESPRASMF